MAGEEGRDLSVLRHKREATRYRILVEIAERQPAVSQREIADAIGITTQAVSDYVGDLVEEGHVRKGGRGRYRITKEGVDWVISRTDELRAFTEHVAAEVVGQVGVEAAIATGPIEAGQPVALSMRDGALHASPRPTQSEEVAGGGSSGASRSADGGGARARAVTGGDVGEAVGVTDFEGLLDYERGAVTVLSIPAIASGETVDPPALDGYLGPRGDRDHADGDGVTDRDHLVAVAGTEALALARAVDLEPDLRFGTPEAVQAAAARGIDVLLVAVEDEVSAHVDRLREQGLAYEVVELGER